MAKIQETKMQLSAIFVLAIFFCQNATNAAIYDVTNYGAIGDGTTDNSAAFKKAWRAVCHGSGSDNGGHYSSSVLLIPSGGTFVLSPTTFQGPCNSLHVTVKVQGHVIASTTNQNSWASERQCLRWITFKGINNLVVEGSGSFHGQGEQWWVYKKNKTHKKKSDEDEEPNNEEQKTMHGKKPRKYQKHCIGKSSRSNLAFFGCNHLRVYGISSQNSVKNHISLSQCEDAVISDVTLQAPQNSPNTDGIDISRSSGITIKDSHIGTGDDCIAINSETSYVNISNVNCGPGHGISIGSFNRKEANVHDIHVRDCTFSGTTNGARIKNYLQGKGGYVKSITFQDITLNNVKYPIIIDQYYGEKKLRLTGAETEAEYKQGGGSVKISDVKFIGFRGTCSGKEAIVLKCCAGSPCTDITLRDVNIRGSNGQHSVGAVSYNAHGTAESTFPRVRGLTGGGDDYQWRDHDGSMI